MRRRNRSGVFKRDVDVRRKSARTTTGSNRSHARFDYLSGRREMIIGVRCGVTPGCVFGCGCGAMKSSSAIFHGGWINPTIESI